MGSVMIGNVFTVETRKSEVVLQHAKDFLKQYYTSIRRSVNIVKVLKQIRRFSEKITYSTKLLFS
jgi:hypothetical protein